MSIKKNKQFSSIKLMIICCLLHLSFEQITVLAPQSLHNSETILFKEAKFSDIPYGKTIRGFIFYSEMNLCNIDELPNLDSDYYYSDVSKPDNAIFILAPHTEKCSYSTLAKSAKKLGSSVLIIISNDDTYKDTYNIEDKLSDSVSLPTIIVTNSSSKDIVSQFKANVDVQISIKFEKKYNDKISIELYLRSDNIKSLSFFKEFNEYYLLLKDKIIFEPIYKYYECSDCQISNTNDETPENSCVRSTDFCGRINPSKKN